MSYPDRLSTTPSPTIQISPFPTPLQSILSFSHDLLMIWSDVLAYVLVCLRPESYILMRLALYQPGLLSPKQQWIPGARPEN